MARTKIPTLWRDPDGSKSRRAQAIRIALAFQAECDDAHGDHLADHARQAAIV
jgi:hypothetical protein